MPDKRPHRSTIVFLNNFSRMGGAERCLVEVLSRFDFDRFNPCLITTMEGDFAHDLRAVGVKVLFCPLPERIASMSRTAMNLSSFMSVPLDLVRYLSRLSKKIRSLHPDLIYSNSLKDHITSALLSFRLRRPVVWHFRDFIESPKLLCAMELLAFISHTRIIANSEFTRGRFSRLLQRGDRLLVARDGIDLDWVDGQRKESPSGGVPASDGPIIGQVGALCPEKGQKLLLRALPAIAKVLPGVSAWIVGAEMYATSRHGKGYRAELEALAKELGVTDRVHFFGYRTDVISIIERTDIVVSACDPSLWMETFGRTVAEAMMCKKAVASSACGGPLEIIEEGVTGTFFTDYTSRALADAVIRLASDKSKMNRMGEAGRRRAEELFTVERCTRDIERHLEAILSAKGRR